MNKKRKKIIISIFIIFVLGCFIYVSTSGALKSKKAINEIDQNQVSINIKEDPVEKEDLNKYFSEDIDLNEYRTKYHNRNIVARLEIPNMFNILVVQASNNDYYLNHDIENKNDVKGTEFLDYRISTDSKQINIYGHNSQTYDIPFRKLENFLDEEYFNSNMYILLQDDNGRKIYKIFAIKEVDSDYSHMKVNLTGAAFVDHVKNLSSNVIFSRDVTYDESSKILVLQTCSYTSSKSYYVISAILVE